MKLITFQTHTLAIIKDMNGIVHAFNVWSQENPNTTINHTEYTVNQRINKHGTKYEELTLLVFYHE